MMVLSLSNRFLIDLAHNIYISEAMYYDRRTKRMYECYRQSYYVMFKRRKLSAQRPQIYLFIVWSTDIRLLKPISLGGQKPRNPVKNLGHRLGHQNRQLQLLPPQYAIGSH